MLSGMIEYKVDLLAARDSLGHIVMAATYGDARYVIRRYGKVIAFVGGIADLEYLHDRDKEFLALVAKQVAKPAPPADPLDELRKMHQRGEQVPWPRTPEEVKLHARLALEIGEKLIRAATTA